MGINYTPATWSAGEVPPASKFNTEIRDPLTGIQAAWTSYASTFTWTGSTSNPSIGNGTITAAYQQIGKTVLFRIVITWGSTTTNGGGYYTFGLPVATNGTYTANSALGGSGYAIAGSASPLAIRRGNTATTFYLDATTTGAVVTSTSPFTWASGNSITASGMYEAA